jgi:hypothetical protein
MKKAKIMLLAIAIFGTVGGIFAFKANKFSLIPFYSYTTINGKGYCAKTTSLLYTTAVESGAPTITTHVSTTYNTAVSTTTCPLVTLYSFN